MAGPLSKLNATILPDRNATHGGANLLEEEFPHLAGFLKGLAGTAPEDPALKRLFGVTRDDLYQIGGMGLRKGNITEAPYKTAPNPTGNPAAENLTTPRNTQRMQDIIAEAMQHPELHDPMASWYVMDPLYDQFKRLHGEGAPAAYNQFNALTGMASPGSEVLTELNRGTGANWLANQGRMDDFVRYAGIADDRRGAGFPDDMRGITGHPYHSTAQAPAMQKFVDTGAVDMKSAKVPSYIAASGVPDVGFQTGFPVGDAHWSRLVGLPDVREMRTSKGVNKIPNASATVPEMSSLTPWWAHEVAAPTGLEPVPAQAVVWGAGSGATGVTSPIGAPKLELLAQQIMKTADRRGVSPETARDMVLTGKTHAGRATPGALTATAAAGAGAAETAKYLLGGQDQAAPGFDPLPSPEPLGP